MNGHFKVVKIYATSDLDNMHGRIEMFVDPPEAFMKVFDRCINLMITAVREFGLLMRGEKD